MVESFVLTTCQFQGEDENELKTVSGTSIQQCKEQLKEFIKRYSDKHKDLHGSISKIGKVIDKVSVRGSS